MSTNRITVIKGDKQVYVDGKPRMLEQADSSLPSYIRAIQWYGDADPPYGEIEFEPDQSGRQFPNVKFKDFTPFKYLQDDFEVKEIEERLERERLEREELEKSLHEQADPPRT